MFKLPTLLIATTIAGSSLQGIHAITENKNEPQYWNKKYIIVNESSIRSNTKIQELCEKLGITSIDHLICPDVNKPNTDKPDTDKPNTDKPDTNSSISQYAKQVADLVNEERAKVGLAPLTLDVTISKAATTRSKEIQTSFSHTRPNGTSFSTVLKENGITYKGSGENIAWGQKTPKEVMKAWMNSNGHRANILNKNYTKIGVGYIKDRAGTAYWTQLFTY